MSAPHFYSTDRYCMVLSGIWWCNSGADCDPAACVPVPAGSYVRRVALTPHYGIVMSGWRPLIKGYFGAALVVGAVMSSASHEGSSVNSFSADGDPR
jgi:hypothetical protein